MQGRLSTVGVFLLANPSLSPDGNRVAFSRVGGGDVSLIDMQGAVSQLTSSLALDCNPVWSPDGRRLFYESSHSNIYSRSVIDATPEEPLLKERTMIYPLAVSPDGSVLLYTRAPGFTYSCTSVAGPIGGHVGRSYGQQ